MQVTADTGSGSPVFVLKQDGQALTGTYEGNYGSAPVTGSVAGSEFELTYEISGVVVTYAGTVDGNSCKGDVDYGMYGKAAFTGTK